MRLRNVKGAREKIESEACVVKDPERWKGNWKEFFGNKNPIHIEIGMGKGKFLLHLAEKYPNINYIGIEKYSSVLVRAIEKKESFEGNNIALIRFDAEMILNIFGKEEIEKIYLNFSDPWPKDRHAKRRLTSKEFLDRYHVILEKNGEIQFRTDNRDLFEFSLETVADRGWRFIQQTNDLHGSADFKEDETTEYEDKFSKSGKQICQFIVRRFQ